MMGEFAEKPWFVMTCEMHDARMADGLDGFLHAVHSLQGMIPVNGIVQVPILREKKTVVNVDKIQQSLVRHRQATAMLSEGVLPFLHCLFFVHSLQIPNHHAGIEIFKRVESRDVNLSSRAITDSSHDVSLEVNRP